MNDVVWNECNDVNGYYLYLLSNSTVNANGAYMKFSHEQNAIKTLPHSVKVLTCRPTPISLVAMHNNCIATEVLELVLQGLILTDNIGNVLQLQTNKNLDIGP